MSMVDSRSFSVLLLIEDGIQIHRMSEDGSRKSVIDRRVLKLRNLQEIVRCVLDHEAGSRRAMDRVINLSEH